MAFAMGAWYQRLGNGERAPTTAGQSPAAQAVPYFDDFLDAQVRKLNPKYAEGPGALVGDLLTGCHAWHES